MWTPRGRPGWGTDWTWWSDWEAPGRSLWTWGEIIFLSVRRQDICLLSGPSLTRRVSRRSRATLWPMWAISSSSPAFSSSSSSSSSWPSCASSPSYSSRRRGGRRRWRRRRGSQRPSSLPSVSTWVWTLPGRGRWPPWAELRRKPKLTNRFLLSVETINLLQVTSPLFVKILFCIVLCGRF